MWIVEHGDKIGGLATVFLAIFAAIAALVAWKQIGDSRATQREATAMKAYREYLLLAFEHPDYANPAKKIIADYRYRWFVAALLSACDDILVSVPNDPD